VLVGGEVMGERRGEGRGERMYRRLRRVVTILSSRWVGGPLEGLSTL
jgi:hypothetical protein